MTQPSTFAFVAGSTGPWRITSVAAVAGQGVVAADRLAVTAAPAQPNGEWTLLGTISNVRYANRAEVTGLRARQADLDRAEASRAALIPVRKSEAWWALAQDERRDILEEQSHHTAIGMEYLPEVARRLYHSRDLGQPFDFLTWFEFAPEHEERFDHLLERLRSSPEWAYVEREVDVRLSREGD